MGFFRGVAGSAGVAACMLTMGGADAQEQLSLTGGFTPDPVVRPFSAQGAEPTATLVRGCPGHVPAAPVLITRLEGANAPLRVFARGSGLSAIVTVGPDGVYRCGPADAQGVAHVRYERALSGDYAFWPATAFPGATASGDVLLSEIDIELDQVPAMVEGGAATAEAAFDAAAEPAWGVFALPPDNGVAMTLETAPTASLSGLDAACSGSADPSRPDLVISLAQPEAQLHIFARAELDATLAVVAPDGAVFCADDAIGSNPLVTLTDAAAGEYVVWVGAWSDAIGEAVVTADRVAPEGTTPGGAGGGALTLDLAAPPAWGVYTLPPAGPLSVGLTLSGVDSASGHDAACSGSINPARPDVTVTLPQDEPAIHISAASAVDTTLLVVGPDGATWCADDLGGINPGVTISGAVAGDYTIWVGVWSGAEGSAELTVDRAAPEEEGADAFNPFAGVTITSAVQALDIVMAQGAGEALSYGRLEETGPEGFILHDVVISDPEGGSAPVRIARLVVSDLDLAGMSNGGAAERFSFRIDGLDYAALATASMAQDGPPLPMLDPAPPLNMAFSMLPPGGDEGRRAIAAQIDLEGMMTLDATATMMWSPGMAAAGPPDPETMIAERIDVEFRDLGFVGAVFDAVAQQEGRPRDALIEEVRAMMVLMLPAGPAGSPLDSLRKALTAKFAAIDGRGVLTMSFAPNTPMSLGDIGAALEQDPTGAGVGQVSIGYTPLP